MKKTLFVALAATVALLATSCKKEEAPKASFSYENDGLVVSFTNLSKNADTYKWEFGDGQTSTETNPKHTYAANGNYTVVLTATGKGGTANYSEEVSLKVAAIKIDGDFADWDAVIADKAVSNAAVFEFEKDVEYEDSCLSKFAAYMDADFIYFMLICDADKDKVMPLDILFGVQGELEDEVPCTSDWNPIYCDYLCEFGMGDSFEPDETKQNWYDWQYDTFFANNHEATKAWDFGKISQNVCDLSDKVLIDGGKLMQVEGRIALANFTLMNKDYMYICAFVSNSGWGESGHAPAAKMDQGSAVAQPQLKVEFSGYDK